jgi:hypothetical protein
MPTPTFHRSFCTCPLALPQGFSEIGVGKIREGFPRSCHTREVDICDYFGVSSSHPPYVVHLFLDPEKYDKPPLLGEPISKNPHWMQLKDALEPAAHTSGSPIMCNGGMDYRRFKCKLRNHVYRPKLGKKDGTPR